MRYLNEEPREDSFCIDDYNNNQFGEYDEQGYYAETDQQGSVRPKFRAYFPEEGETK